MKKLIIDLVVKLYLLHARIMNKFWRNKMKLIERIATLGKVQRELEGIYKTTNNLEMKELTKKTMSLVARLMIFLAAKG